MRAYERDRNSVSLSSGAVTLMGNTAGNAALSQIGGVAGPSLIDIAVRR